MPPRCQHCEEHLYPNIRHDCPSSFESACSGADAGQHKRLGFTVLPEISEGVLVIESRWTGEDAEWGILRELPSSTYSEALGQLNECRDNARGPSNLKNGNPPEFRLTIYAV